MVKWKFTHRIQADRTEVYVVDEHGCFLNTEPVCIIISDYHPWFSEWLKNQPCEYPNYSPLLWHPALGETMEGYIKNTYGEEDEKE